MQQTPNNWTPETAILNSMILWVVHLGHSQKFNDVSEGRQCISAELHGITKHKIVLFVVTDVRTSKLAEKYVVTHNRMKRKLWDPCSKCSPVYTRPIFAFLLPVFHCGLQKELIAARSRRGLSGVLVNDGQTRPDGFIPHSVRCHASENRDDFSHRETWLRSQ